VTPIDRYSLEPHTGPYDSWPLDSALRVNGVLTQARVPGCVVEAQYETILGDILVTSHDCPFEESNTFVLLDSSHAIVSRAELGIPYDSFLLHEHWPADASTIGLHYHESTFYTLQVLAPGGLLGRKPRLKLRRCVAWKKDARMPEAHARLQVQLSEIESTLRARANESAA
jgi:hypothetical protein